MNIHILSIFPHILDSYINESIIKRAQENKFIKIQTHDLRDWTTDKHRSVDDTPFGGGAGMLMKIEPLYRALKDIKKKIGQERTRTILLSARGKGWKQSLAQDYARDYENLIFICGRYEGVDERLLNYIDIEISIGDYVLTGGELGAMVMIDSIVRLLPGVLGNPASPESESHSVPGVLEYPQYTRPETFQDDEGQVLKVPEVLLSGDHAKIEAWKEKNKKTG